MVLKNKPPSVALKIVHTIPCGEPGVSAMSHVVLESFQDLELATMVLLVLTVLVTNTNKPNAMPPTRVSPCGPTGLNALLHVAEDTSQDNDPTFAPMKSTNRPSLVTKTLVHGQHGPSGLLAVHLVVVVKLIAAEFTVVLANGKNRLCVAMFTVVATEAGVPGVNALQHVMVVPNIAHDHMIADNLMILKLFSVAPLVFTLAGPNGHHVLYVMVSKMNSF